MLNPHRQVCKYGPHLTLNRCLSVIKPSITTEFTWIYISDLQYSTPQYCKKHPETKDINIEDTHPFTISSWEWCLWLMMSYNWLCVTLGKSNVGNGELTPLSWVKATMVSLKLIFTKPINLVSPHHVLYSCPGLVYKICLWWDCSKDTRFTILVKISFTDSLWSP